MCPVKGEVSVSRKCKAYGRCKRSLKLIKSGVMCPVCLALPVWLQVMFSRPLPDFSCRLNALATAVTCQWLMGPCKVNDVELDDGRVRLYHCCCCCCFIDLAFAYHAYSVLSCWQCRNCSDTVQGVSKEPVVPGGVQLSSSCLPLPARCTLPPCVGGEQVGTRM